MEKLTQQQKRFVSEYIRTLDGETSAKNAGYKAKNLKSFAQTLLTHPNIVKEINIQLRAQISALNVQRGYVVKKLLQIAEFSLDEEDILDKDGNYTGKRKLRDSTAGLRALDGLCKYLGFSLGNTESENGHEFKIITIANLDDEKI